jgi:chorismate dehydratase
VWCRWTKLPFVFAMWVAGKGSGFRVQGSGGEIEELAAILNEVRNLGVASVEAIARREHQAVGLSYEDCLVYLRDHLHFRLGKEEAAGLELFRQHAVRRGLAPKGRHFFPLPLGEGQGEGQYAGSRR